ncbi:MAG: ribosome maturation factor RimM [Lachnospiraceae bacterium]|nr:ribosome maturation factor RimM [Lachnospiraceae bacterium]MDE6185902.1 ribosome maturation factor RimM [Lachnospiraceae bacterium]MDE7286327.1 ribosome maturation factor RimM [Lachnospiraceae bacterium]
MESLLQVGIISSTHGIKGEVKVFPTTDDANRFKKLKEVLLDTGKETLSLKIESVKFFKQFVILKFKGFDSINDIEKYKGKRLLVTRENAVELKEDEYFIADLEGVNVVSDDGKYKGVLVEVIETGANDVYAIRLEDGRMLLIPAIKECILLVNLEENRMLIHVLDGLLDDTSENEVEKKS